MDDPRSRPRNIVRGLVFLVIGWFALMALLPNSRDPCWTGRALEREIRTNLSQLVALGRLEREAGREFGFAEASRTLDLFTWSSEEMRYLVTIQEAGQGWVVLCMPERETTYARPWLALFLLLDFREKHWPMFRLGSEDAEPKEWFAWDE